MATFNRRDFLRTGFAGSLLFTAGGRASAAAPRRRLDPGAARNIIVLVSDGMSLGTLTLAERYRRRFDERGTHWLGLYRRPDLHRALMDTASASSLVTDSAAASSAWGCGFKVNNGSINITPDGQPRTPVLAYAQAAGRATGLVTTARMTHATPAGFAAQADSRTDEARIAEQYLQRGIHVLLGGGSDFLSADTRADQRDLFAEYARAGYHVARDRATLGRLPTTGRLIGVFGRDHLPYSLDLRSDEALSRQVPPLAEMTRAALQRLDHHDRGFVLQVEGARVDHAAHANDVGALVHEQLAFDEAVGEVLRYAEGRDDTLVFVMTDHGNANPGLNGTGGSFASRSASYGETQRCFERLADFRRTNTWIMEGLNAESSPGQIRDRVREANGIALLDEELSLLHRALRKDPAPREGYRVRNEPPITLGQVLSNYTAVGWTGTQHTTDLVEVAAFGPGSDAVHGLIQNQEIFNIMTRAIGVTTVR